MIHGTIKWVRVGRWVDFGWERAVQDTVCVCVSAMCG